MPAQNGDQKLLSAKIHSPGPHRSTRDRLGNEMVYLEWKGKADPRAEVRMTFLVERSPSDGVGPEAVAPGSPLDPERHLGSHARVPVHGIVRKLAEQESRGLSQDSQKIRAYYDYVIRTMRYGKHGKGWGQGDAVWACTSKYGNCTDFHSVFLGMARSQSIPARFVMGFPIPADTAQGSIAGYHCWAEVYDPSRGWIPLDASEAWKSGRIEDYFGKLPSDRIEFSVGRDLVLDPLQRGGPLNYFIYPYAEVDGQPVEKVPASFHFRRLPAEGAS